MSDREAALAKALAQTPRGYLPLLHLGAPSLFAIVTVIAAVWHLEDPWSWALLTVPITFVLSNAGEWRIHHSLLHRRSRIAPVLYDRHTPEHHRIYTFGSMAMGDFREIRLVLIPAYGIVLVAVATFPLALALGALLGRDVGLYYLATTILYTMTYEWLHLAYHLPESHPVARLSFVRALARHHALHHHPALMQRWNMNVTVPIWDLVRGTYTRDVPG